MRAGCGGPLIEIDRRQLMREQMALKQRMTEELRVLEELVQVRASAKASRPRLDLFMNTSMDVIVIWDLPGQCARVRDYPGSSDLTGSRTFVIV